MVRDPRVFLMDEPLSNLDAKLRVEIRAEIADLQRELGITTLYVTHDQVEAMTLGDRIAVLLEGRLRQVATAKELYDRPVDAFVASFVGGPSMNLFRSRICREGEGEAFDFGNRTVPIEPGAFDGREAARGRTDEPLLLGLRPEGFVEGEGADEDRRIAGKVHATEELGHERIVYFEAEEERVPAPDGPTGGGPGEREEAEEASPESYFVARLPARGPIPGRGDAIELGIDTTRLHFFEVEGRAIYEE
jgi:multiple sugar transport system ATP-binding protein